MKRVLSIGHAAYDITIPISSYPIENQKMRVGVQTECGGGSAANCAALVSKWGMDSYFVGSVGQDHYGKLVKNEFERDNVKTDYLMETDHFGTTASYILANISNGSRTIIVSRTKKEESANMTLPTDIDLIIADGEEPSLTIKAIKQNPRAISILDAGNLKEPIVRLCPYVTYVISSQDFAREYTKNDVIASDMNSLIRAYEIMKKDFRNNIIITLGADGAFTKVNGKYKLFKSIVVKPKDSTAAGDIFHGAFAYFITNGYSLEDAMVLSNITGGLSTLKIGGRNSIPPLKSVYEYLHNSNK